jgi:hypothetical protein
MFVVSAMGYLHGPFRTADQAAQFGDDLKDSGPWSIIPIKPRPDRIVDEASIHDTEGVKRVLKSVSSKRPKLREVP